ncbi:MAG: hypothetical protein HY843_00770 [Bdellovibrio sp.]|nr:hypothetical protein [Bdellovibrio sp.]
MKEDKNLQTVVYGDGAAALGAIASLLLQNKKVLWITGQNTRLLPVLSVTEDGHGLQFLKAILTKYETDPGELKTDSFLREYRYKSFHEAAWMKGQTQEERASIRSELLCARERYMAPLFQTQFENLSFIEIFETLRKKLLNNAQLRHYKDCTINSIAYEKEKRITLVLSSGEEIFCDLVFVIDTEWIKLSKAIVKISGLESLKLRHSLGVVQLVLKHRRIMGEDLSESFYMHLNKETNEDIKKHTWGYFFSDGEKSLWSAVLEPEELEDNHEITKKIRKIKQALDRTFCSDPWLKDGEKYFTSTVCEEQVRLIENAFYEKGEPVVSPLCSQKLPGLVLLLEGYGVDPAFCQIERHFGS